MDNFEFRDCWWGNTKKEKKSAELFVDKWEVYVSVDDKMSVVIAFEKLKNTSREECPLGSNFCGYVVQFSLILCF